MFVSISDHTWRRSAPMPLLACLSFFFSIVAAVLAQEPPLPTTPVEDRVSESTDVEPGAVAMDQYGQFVVAWPQGYVNPHNQEDLLIQYYGPDGTPFTEDPLVVTLDQPMSGRIVHRQPSISMSLNSHIRLAWLGQSQDSRPVIGPILLQEHFDWAGTPSAVPGEKKRGRY